MYMVPISFVLLYLLWKLNQGVRVLGNGVAEGLAGKGAIAASSKVLAPAAAAPVGDTPETSQGKFLVEVKLNKVVLADESIQYKSDWRLKEGLLRSKKEKEDLDMKVNNFCRHLAQEETTPNGESVRTEWFN